MAMNVAGFSSETGLFIEDALKRAREVARLDDDPVLPPLPVTMPRSKVVRIATKDMPWKPAPSSTSVATPVSGIRPKAQRRSARWPLAVCAFVASIFAGAAFMSSPLGARPEVRRVVEVSKAKTMNAVHTVAALAHR